MKNAIITWAATAALFLLLLTGEVTIEYPVVSVIILAMCGSGLLVLGKKGENS